MPWLLVSEIPLLLFLYTSEIKAITCKILVPDLSTVSVWIADTCLDSTFIIKFGHASNLERTAFGFQSTGLAHLRNLWSRVYFYLE